MQFPESWLRELCDPPIDTATLVETLTMAGLEVESTRPAAPAFRGVVVGEVLGIERHPNADRLNVCRVDVGQAEPLTIVCGAPNVRSGIKVPCALVGAELPPADDSAADEAGREPFRIRLGQIRGVESQGMLCSARELKLSDEHGGLLVLDAGATVGRDIRAELRLDDTLLTLKLTPNLAHCLSLLGVARELSALTGAPLRRPAIRAVAASCDDTLPVRIGAPDLCGRFTGRVLRGVDPSAPTPAWMVDRLARCGQRPVGALVDISNYVMFELGQPTHVFDLDRIDAGLEVRWARPGEALKLLNGATVELDRTVGVIADASRLESLAGIMGGDATAVSDATRNVYLEAAFWWPAAVAGRSRRFGFATDAGHRFERGVDPAGTVDAVERITGLILEICGSPASRCGPVDDRIVALPEPAPIALRVARVERVVGMPIEQSRCEDVMRRLGLPFRSEPGRLEVTPPSWRFDLAIEEDLIEEVIRVVGYPSLPARAPVGTLRPRVGSESRRGVDTLRHAVAALGYQETIGYSFVDERWERELAGNADPIRLLNPMSTHLGVMRSSLLGSLVATLRLNLSRKLQRVRIFELGRTFRRDPRVVDGPLSVAGVDQPLRLAGLAHGPTAALQWGADDRAVDLFDVKGDLESLLGSTGSQFSVGEHPAMHPGRCARVEVDGIPVGHVGELHPRWRQAYELPSAPILFEIEAEALLVRRLPRHRPVQRQQSVWRDLSVIVGEPVTHAVLVAAIATGDPDRRIRSATLFDIWRPKQGGGELLEGERSMSVRLELHDDEAPLTDARIDAAVAGVLASLVERLGARARA